MVWSSLSTSQCRAARHTTQSHVTSTPASHDQWSDCQEEQWQSDPDHRPSWSGVVRPGGGGRGRRSDLQTIEIFSYFSSSFFSLFLPLKVGLCTPPTHSTGRTWISMSSILLLHIILHMLFRKTYMLIYSLWSADLHIGILDTPGILCSGHSVRETYLSRNRNGLWQILNVLTILTLQTFYETKT